MEMVGGQPTIHVMTLVIDPVTTEIFTLPASAEQTTLDLTIPTEIIDFSIKENQSATYDRVAIIGGPDMYVMTLRYIEGGGGQIVRDWDDGEEADYLALPADKSPEGKLKKPFRRFKISSTWNGANHDGSWTLPATRHINSGAIDLYGNGAYDGTLDPGGTLVQGDTFDIMRDLPLPMGYDWDTVDPVDTLVDRKPEAPRIFVKSAGGEWRTIEQLIGLDDEFSRLAIEIDQRTGAITLGEEVQPYVSDLADGDSIYFTICIRHQLPLMDCSRSPPPESGHYRR